MIIHRAGCRIINTRNIRIGINEHIRQRVPLVKIGQLDIKQEKFVVPPDKRIFNGIGNNARLNKRVFHCLASKNRCNEHRLDNKRLGSYMPIVGWITGLAPHPLRRRSKFRERGHDQN